MEMSLARTERWDRGGGMDTGKIVVVQVKDLGQFWLGISTLKRCSSHLVGVPFQIFSEH